MAMMILPLIQVGDKIGDFEVVAVGVPDKRDPDTLVTRLTGVLKVGNKMVPAIIDRKQTDMLELMDGLEDGTFDPKTLKRRKNA